MSNEHKDKFIGKEFGDFKVLELIKTRIGDNKTYVCQCMKCGTLRLFRKSDLTKVSRPTRFCECKREENVKRESNDDYYNGTQISKLNPYKKRQENNTSGITGVSKKGNCWQARIQVGGRRCGEIFERKEDAVKARKFAEKVMEHTFRVVKGTRVIRRWDANKNLNHKTG